jgi:hypothetical protein
MLYAIHKGYVEGYHDGQDDILHLEAQIEQIILQKLPYVFSDGHAVISLSKFFNDPKDLRMIDWQLMKSTYWNDTQEDSDRKRKRQAEFLIHTFFPLGTCHKNWYQVAQDSNSSSGYNRTKEQRSPPYY